MFDQLTFEEMREWESRLFSGFAKAEFIWTTRERHPMAQELADVSLDADIALTRLRRNR